MALQETLGSMAVQVEADLTKWKKDVEGLKNDAKKDAEEIEKSYAKIGPAGVKSISGLVRSFKGIDAAIVNNVKSTNDLIKVNDRLYLEVSKKTGKLVTTYRILDDAIQKNVKGNVLGWQMIGRAGETELNKTSRSVRIFGTGLGNASRKMGLLGYEVARAAGETGKFGSLMGQIGAGMLTGGYIGAGLAAGAAAINLIAEKARHLTQTIKDALSKLIDFKDGFKDIEFQVSTGDIRQQTEFIENRVKQLKDNITQRDIKILSLAAEGVRMDDFRIRSLEKQNEQDEKRVVVNEEYLEKLKEQKDLEDALGITKQELNNLGLKELTITDKINTELNDQKKIIDGLKTALNDPNLTGDARLAVQNKLNAAIEDYNSLLGKQDENESVDDLIKKIKTENELKALTSGLTTEILESSKRLLENSISLAKTDEERVKILSTIRDIEKEIAELTPTFEIEEIDGGKYAEELNKSIAEEEEKRQAAEKEATETLQELKLRGIANEFDEREARINAEYDLLLEKYQDNAEIIAEIEKARQTDLLRLEHQRFTAMLGFANQIGDILINKLGIAGHTFVGQMMRALDIATSILTTLSNLSGALGGGGGLFGLFSSFIPGGGLIASAAGARAGGGPVEKGKFYKVGEHGEEWFRPWTSGTIVPNSEVRASLTRPVIINQDNRDDRLLNAIQAMNMNLVHKDMSVTVRNEAPGVKTTVVTNEKTKNNLTRSGVDFNER